MIGILMIVGALSVLVLGIWIGVGAPGWPHRPIYRRRHSQKRPLNPVQWGRTQSSVRTRRFR